MTQLAVCDLRTSIRFVRELRLPQSRYLAPAKWTQDQLFLQWPNTNAFRNSRHLKDQIHAIQTHDSHVVTRLRVRLIRSFVKLIGCRRLVTGICAVTYAELRIILLIHFGHRKYLDLSSGLAEVLQRFPLDAHATDFGGALLGHLRDHPFDFSERYEEQSQVGKNRRIVRTSFCAYDLSRIRPTDLDMKGAGALGVMHGEVTELESSFPKECHRAHFQPFNQRKKHKPDHVTPESNFHVNRLIRRALTVCEQIPAMLEQISQIGNVIGGSPE
jgi:hypothetical protein